jgi:hypothetical protein
MIDDCSDWMSFNDTVAHIEATQKCYEELAIRSLKEAADSLKIRSRTVQVSPRWVEAGNIYYSDNGKDLQFRREDVLKLWPEQQKEAAAPRRSSRGAQAVAVDLAFAACYPGGVPEGLSATDRNREILKWIVANNKSIPTDIAKAVQRGLKRAKHSS